MSHEAREPFPRPEPVTTTPPSAASPWRGRALWALAAVMGATLWFRSPMLLNAGAVNSDAALVGLQARHMLRGEWSPFLWGAGYQSSFEAAIAAAIFAVAGATPLALALVPLLGHLLLTFFAWDVLRKRTSPWKAALLVTPIVLAPMPVNTIILNVARSWAITAVFASVWLLDGASRSRRPLVRLAAGGFFGLFAVYLDLFSLVFLGGIAILAVAATLDDAPPPETWRRRLLACGGGAIAGLVFLWIIRSSSGASQDATLLTTKLFARNLDLLVRTCVPWLLGAKTFIPTGGLYPAQWTPPAAYAWVPIAGACCFVGLFAVSSFATFSRARSDWRVARLGLFGLVVVVSTIAAFLFSATPHDMWSARYLAPVIFAAPFLLAPAQRALGRWFYPLVVSYLLSATVSGWLAYGDATTGPLPARSSSRMDRDVATLRDELRARGVRHGVAHYWLAYRLSFLFEEDPVVVPLDPTEDRYAPHRNAVVAAPEMAFIFHPSEPRARPETVESMLRQDGTRFERMTVGEFTVLVAYASAR